MATGYSETQLIRAQRDMPQCPHYQGVRIKQVSSERDYTREVTFHELVQQAGYHTNCYYG